MKVIENDVLKAINACFRYHFDFGQSEMPGCETLYGQYVYTIRCIKHKQKKMTETAIEKDHIGKYLLEMSRLRRGDRVKKKKSVKPKILRIEVIELWRIE